MPKSAPLPALSANGRPMSATAGLGVFGSGGAFVGGCGDVGRGFPGGSSILVGIAAFVVAMAFVGAMLIFGKLVL